MSKKTSDNITDTEHDHGNIIIPRSDGKLHDLNVFANIAPDFAKDALRESPKIKPTTSLGPLEDHDHDHEHRPISVRRSDGLTHDIVQVFKAFSDPNGDSLRLIPSTKVDEGIRRSTLGKLDMQNIIKSSGRLPLPPQINTFNPSSIRIVHMSDTLNFLNKSSNYNNFLPPGDILIHSGNFTNTGSDEEFDTFDKWLKSVANIYHYRVVVLGSRDVIKIGNNWTIAKSMLPSATHVLSHSEATILGLRIYGMPWHWGHDANYLLKAGVPDSNRLNDIPDKVDILVTHGPAYGRLDTVVLDSPSPKTVKGDSLLQEEHWGSQVSIHFCIYICF